MKDPRRHETLTGRELAEVARAEVESELQTYVDGEGKLCRLLTARDGSIIWAKPIDRRVAVPFSRSTQPDQPSTSGGGDADVNAPASRQCDRERGAENRHVAEGALGNASAPSSASEEPLDYTINAPDGPCAALPADQPSALEVETVAHRLFEIFETGEAHAIGWELIASDVKDAYREHARKALALANQPSENTEENTNG